MVLKTSFIDFVGGGYDRNMTGMLTLNVLRSHIVWINYINDDFECLQHQFPPFLVIIAL